MPPMYLSRDNAVSRSARGLELSAIPCDTDSTFDRLESIHFECRQLVLVAEINQLMVVSKGIDKEHLNIVIVYFRALQREAYVLFHLVKGC